MYIHFVTKKKKIEQYDITLHSIFDELVNLH